MCLQYVQYTRFYGCGCTVKEWGSKQTCDDPNRVGHVTKEHNTGSGKHDGKCGQSTCPHPCQGRTAFVYRVKEGLVCKVPSDTNSDRYRAEIENAFVVEKRLLERLGHHPRIVHPYTIEGMKEGLLLDEANCGNLQSYIDSDDYKSDETLREKWSLQVAEAVSYVHDNGIIHSNLSTENVLVHGTGQRTDLILADFGGSKCLDLDLNGHLLPDEPFFDPHIDIASPKIDIFSLGMIIYIINTAHYPFHGRPAPANNERRAYEDFVRSQFEKNEFPDLSGVPFRDVIAGCCIERRFETAHEVVLALKAEMRYNTLRRSTMMLGCIIFLGCTIFLACT
ncbi:kinase-like protein [Setomelanomma holmii]|uniref:Kinase-like protein n=1 Tax=Setomelanomma holmii TaxID=210430 RepID=A0A9P4LGZ4_9PLEO|nr:kinase-like protein [Setomelanomma holmii]